MTKETRDRRLYSREFKLEALRRMETALNVTALAEELGVQRELLYVWRRKVARGGPEALRSQGRPRPEPGTPPAAPETLSPEARIAQLERQLGQQAIAIDFFKGALRRIEASRRVSTKPGATASSRRSER